MDISGQIIEQIQTFFLDMGPSGIKNLPRVFHYMDKDGSQTVSKDEFRRGLNTFDMGITDWKLDEVFNRFDKDKSGQIDIKEFVKTLEPRMSPSRESVVKKCFAEMDKDGDGVITVEDLKASRRQSSEAELRAFLESFEPFDDRDGKVTFDEFMCYYKCLGAGMQEDMDFIEMLIGDWQV